MKAVYYTTYRGPEVLHIKEVEKPLLREDEVLMKVHAVSLNDWNLALLEGDFVNRVRNGFAKPKITYWAPTSSRIIKRLAGLG